MILPPKYQTYNPLKSVVYAWQGIGTAFTREPNIRIQLVLLISMVIISYAFALDIFLLLNLVLGGMVMAFECVNTAFETLCDLVQPEFSARVKDIKDIVAGAVLLAALSWLLVILFQVVQILQFL